MSATSGESRHRVTKADLDLLRRCRRSKATFSESGVIFSSEYRRKGSVTTYRQVSGDGKPSVVVTPRAKRLLSMGLVERTLFIFSHGPDGDLTLTDEGRHVVDSGGSGISQ